VPEAHLETRAPSTRPAAFARRLAAVAVVGLTLAACSRSSATEDPNVKSAESRTSALADRVRVRVENPSRDTIASYLETTCHVEAIREADLYTKATGVVRKLLCEEGDAVKDGQVLAVLDQVEVNINLKQAEIELEESARAVEEAELAHDEAQKKESLATIDAAQAKRDYDRDAKLSTSGDEAGLRILAPKVVEASKLAWDRAENAWQVAQFAVRKAELAVKASETNKTKAAWAVELAKVRLADTEIKAPFAGVVSMRGVKVGETATTQTRVFRVTDLDNLQTVFHRPQRDLRVLGRGGQDVVATSEAVPLDPDSNAPRVFEGHVERISPVVDPQSGSFKVTASLKNPGQWLRPGILVRVKVTLGRRENAFLIPKRARVLDGERPYVFVIRDGKTVRIPIDEGFSDDHRVEVRNVREDGLHADDQVVVVASVDLKEGIKVQLESAPATPGG
jgi:RND family efflux transporter MFP subunit